MSFLIQLFPPKIDLPTPLARAIDVWRALPVVADDTPLDRTRFVVVDVMSNSFDARRGHLLGLGAVAIEHLRVVSGDAVSLVLPSLAADADGDEMAPETEEALSEFLAFAGKSPCAAVHAAFAQTVLDRSLRAELGVQTSNPWIDLARLAPQLFPEVPPRRSGVDGWLRHFGLRVLVRDNPPHDAQVAAGLLLILLERALACGITTLGALRARHCELPREQDSGAVAPRP